MSLLIRDVFLHDPTETDIPNDGVAKVGEPETEQQWRVLEHELSTFVCKGEYERGLYRILNSFVSHLDQSSQPAAWVSGFYGSGKSHLVRVLEQLWRDTTFPDGDTARNMVKLPREIDELLRELTTIGDRRGGLWSAAGTLSSSGDVGVRLAILAVMLRAAGLPEAYAQAQLVLRLKHEGAWDAVEASLIANNRSVDYELQNMYASPPLHAAILEAYPGFAQDAREARGLVREQFPRRTDISNQEFVATIESVLELVSKTPSRRPCALVVLDELQQFISNDPQIALEVQEAVDYSGAALRHPVCREIHTFIGAAGKRGAEVRQRFGAPPYGWSQDAIDGALMTLLAVESITARHEGEDRTAQQLSRPNVSRAEFRVPDVDEMPTPTERANVRGFVLLVTGTDPQREALSEETLNLLNALLALANEAGGNPPLPARPDTATIDELRTLTGNRRVKGTAAHLDTLKQDYERWQERKQAIAARLPRWRMLEQMLRLAIDANLPVAADVGDQVAAIRDNHSLLVDPEPTRPLIELLSQALRERLHELHDDLDKARLAEIAVLGRMPEWEQVGAEYTGGIVQRVGLQRRELPDAGTDERLVDALSRTPLSTLEHERFGISARGEQARVEIIQAATPEAVEVALPRRTLSTPEEIDAWLAETGALLHREMTKDGRTRPVIV